MQSQNSSTFNTTDSTEGDLKIIREVFDDGKMYVQNVLENKDTILKTRTYGNHWFGLFAGPNLSLITGNVRWAANPRNIAPDDYPDPDVRGDVIVDYTPIRFNEDFNWFPGIMYEYAPVHWDFGFALRIFPYETVQLNAEYVVPEDQSIGENHRIIFSSQIPYTGISPQLTYKIRYLDLKVWAGADLFFSIGDDQTSWQDDYETISGEILRPTFINNLEDPPVRYGLNLGVEYEYLIMDIFNSTRVKLAPYFMAEWTTSYISDFGSNVSPVILRAGLGVKLGPDKATFDTLKYEPKQINEFIVRFQGRSSISFEGFLVREEIVGSEIDFIAGKLEGASISDEPVFVASTDFSESQVNSDPEPEEPSLNLKAKDIRSYSFGEKERVSPSRNMRNFLDDLAKWMNENPKAEIRIIGHASQDEPFDKQDEIARNRAQSVKSYLLRKGVSPPERILVTGAGARQPKVDNTNEAGRRENRRVDIEVVKIN